MNQKLPAPTTEQREALRELVRKVVRDMAYVAPEIQEVTLEFKILGLMDKAWWLGVDATVAKLEKTTEVTQ